jgi:transcriptional regulator with XRE-family HTH domain
LKSVHTDQYSQFLKLMIAARKSADLTQTGLAEKLGKPQSYVSKYEHGERRLDMIEFLVLAELLNFDPHEFITNLGVKPHKRGAK